MVHRLPLCDLHFPSPALLPGQNQMNLQGTKKSPHKRAVTTKRIKYLYCHYLQLQLEVLKNGLSNIFFFFTFSSGTLQSTSTEQISLFTGYRRSKENETKTSFRKDWKNKSFMHPKGLVMVRTAPEPGFICMILEVLRSTFLISNGKTSVWSVEITSHPSNAMPEKRSQCHTM